MQNLEIVFEDAAALSSLSPIQFAMIRRQGFGASDSSILLGVNPYSTFEKLIDQKASSTISDEELKIGTLPAVKAGIDLEPLIINKFEARFGVTVEKPKPMYRIKGTRLTVNFDGLFHYDELVIPVEAKFISQYGGKYYDVTKALTIVPGRPPRLEQHPENMQHHIAVNAAICGIPAYYYTQVQQQILAADAPFGYLTCLMSKEWEYYTFVVPRDQIMLNELLSVSRLAWTRVQSITKGED